MSRSPRGFSRPTPPWAPSERPQAGLRSRRLARPAGARARRSGRVSFHPGCPSLDVSRQAMDHAAVRGVRDRGGDERAVPAFAHGRSEEHTSELQSLRTISYAVFCLKKKKKKKKKKTIVRRHERKKKKKKQ